MVAWGGHFHPQQCPLQYYLWPHPPVLSRLKRTELGEETLKVWAIGSGLGE